MRNDSPFLWNGSLCVGSRFPLELPALALLNSAQSKYPLGTDEWILGTQAALQSYVGKGFALLSSLGLNTWEFTTWAGGAAGYPIILVMLWDQQPDPYTLFNEITHDLALRQENTTLLLLPSGKEPARELGPFRDHFVVSLAHTVVPVSIHPGGRMDTLLKTTNQSRIDWNFHREWNQKPRGTVYQFDMDALQKEVDPHWKGWLIHWTHACQGPWPGETRASFYHNVTISREEYAHSAKRTLDRILVEERIRTSCWRIRGGQGVVCFSGLAPSQAAQLVRWRARYVRFSIEPFGIGIHPEASKRLGIQPVHYLERGVLPPEEIPAFLLQGSGGSGDWPRENEYRHPGDIDLKTLAAEDWRPIQLPILAGPGGGTP